MDQICEVRNGISDIKVKKDVHSEQRIKDNKRLWDELETSNTIIKFLIDDFKQLTDSLGKSNTILPSLWTSDFSENNFIFPKEYAHREIYNKSKPTSLLWPNCYQLLEPTSENIELAPQNIQNTETLRLPGNVIHWNRNALISQNIGSQVLQPIPSVVIYKYPERQINFLRTPVVPDTRLFNEASLPSKGQRNILIITDNILKAIRIREPNSFITNGKTKIVSCPGATSKEILHYLDVHQTNFFVYTIILYVGVNDLLEDNSQSKIANLGKSPW